MSTKQKFALMGITAFWGVVIYAIGWVLVDWLTDAPSTYDLTIGSFAITINRWVDVLIFPIYPSIILSVYFGLIPRLKNNSNFSRNNFGAVLGVNLVVGLVVGLVHLIKILIKLHKRILGLE